MTITIKAIGGYNAVGGNMTSIEVDNEEIVIDCGIRLDTLQMYDSDTQRLRKFNKEDLIKKRIIPNFHLLRREKAIILSHGHLDHVGALSIIKPKVPIYGLPFAVDIASNEYPEGKFQLKGYNEEFTLTNKVSAEFVEVTHSIPYASIVILNTPEGKIAYASDYRFDNHSQIASTDYRRLKELGNEGIKALIVESLRVGKIGKTPSERTVKYQLEDLFEFIDSGLVIASTFSTHIERIQHFIDCSEKKGRKVLILGRSLNSQVRIADKYGLIKLPDDVKILANAKGINRVLKNLANSRDEYFLIVTGHQGEPDSVLSRMSNGVFDFEFRKGDVMIFGAEVIPTPTNQATRYAIETKLNFRKVKIFQVHAHGHACKEDHRHLLKLLNPEHIIPCHGTAQMKSDYVELGIEEGYELNKNLHLLSDGVSLKI
ncbi:MAG: MBL fold metallo-hydrolase RNA specificity domain-containing protein [Candidatus Altiarchaeota archaeon]